MALTNNSIVSLDYPLLALVWVGLGSIIADIDTYPSLISCKLLVPFFILFSGHRKETHSFLSILLFSMPIAIINPLYSLCFAYGYLTHLLTDSITGGVPYFYPKIKKRYGNKTSVQEAKMIEGFTLAFCFYYIFIIYKP